MPKVGTLSPAFALYLVALALLPFRWLSPISAFQGNAIWSDLLFAAAAVAWLAANARSGELLDALRTWQIPLGVYILLACLSAAVAVPGGGDWSTVLVMVELVALAVITADFGADLAKRRMIARVVVASSVATVILGALGEILFYAHVHTGLVGGYGDLQASRNFVRIQAGFESPPLLASYCIFASGIAASDEAGLGRRIQLATQISLGLLCAATGSRGLIGFILALVLRWSLGGPRTRVAVAVTAVLVGLAIMAALSVGMLHLNPTNPSTASYALGAGGRHELFVSSVHTLLHHPLLGIGPGGFPARIGYGLIRAHFTPLNVAATVGLPALAALVVSLWLLWRARRRPTDVAGWSALLGIGLDGLGQDIDHFRHVWILLGLLSGRREWRDVDQA